MPGEGVSSPLSPLGADAWDRGFVHVYTGDGKGKTTAAFGLALRALGAGLRVFIGQFIKQDVYHEVLALASFGDRVILRQYGLGCWLRGKPSSRDVEAARRGLKHAMEQVRSREFQLVILDEINLTPHFGLLSEEDLLQLVHLKPHPVELVMTGRKAPLKLVQAADLVAEMREIKHYYAKGVLARMGIEH